MFFIVREFNHQRKCCMARFMCIQFNLCMKWKQNQICMTQSCKFYSLMDILHKSINKNNDLDYSVDFVSKVSITKLKKLTFTRRSYQSLKVIKNFFLPENGLYNHPCYFRTKFSIKFSNLVYVFRCCRLKISMFIITFS